MSSFTDEVCGYFSGQIVASKEAKGILDKLYEVEMHMQKACVELSDLQTKITSAGFYSGDASYDFSVFYSKLLEYAYLVYNLYILGHVYGNEAIDQFLFLDNLLTGMYNLGQTCESGEGEKK